jgi:hypothetical protein
MNNLYLFSAVWGAPPSEKMKMGRENWVIDDESILASRRRRFSDAERRRCGRDMSPAKRLY